jgi:hypothetical protein
VEKNHGRNCKNEMSVEVVTANKIRCLGIV